MIPPKRRHPFPIDALIANRGGDETAETATPFPHRRIDWIEKGEHMDRLGVDRILEHDRSIKGKPHINRMERINWILRVTSIREQGVPKLISAWSFGR